jgi:hypothetical protein
MKKTIKRNVSITHESKKTIVIVDGEEIDLNSMDSNSNLLELLNSSNLDDDLISEMLNLSSNDNKTISQDNNNINASVKVECSSCNRTVSYAKGQCIYCGHKLKLMDSNSTNIASNDVDSKYLNTDEIESNETNTDTNYIDRLKDI